MPGFPSPSLTAVFGDALAAARSVRAPADLPAALERISAQIAAALDCGTVSVSLHRPAWDDFETVTIHGSESVRGALRGLTSSWVQWAPCLTPALTRRGIQHLPAGSLTSQQQGALPLLVSRGAARDAGSEAGDLLVAVLRRPDGDVLGLLTAEEPVGGEVADDERLDRLALLSQLAALAVERAQAGRDAGADRAALERLLTITTRIDGQGSRGGVLDEVCAAIRDTLGFDRVAVLLAETTGVLRPAAVAGWSIEDPAFAHSALTLNQLEPLMAPEHERHGCYLLDREEAEALMQITGPPYRSQRNGRGAYAWDRHWLLVPLHDGRGAMRGVIWADDPSDRLLPGRERLQALRLLSGQAARALDPVRDLDDAGRGDGDQDPLTGLPSRGVLLSRLRHALQRVKRSDRSVAVLFLDLDRFREANEALGHSAGDELLRAVASRIDDALRPGDTVARFGGDEYAVLCEDVDGPEAAMEIAERLRTTLAEPLSLPAGEAQVTASIGVALPDRPDRSAEAILQAADRAMYEAKAAGRDAARLAMPGAGWP